MAGFDNEVLYAVGERLQPSNAQAISIMQQFPNATNISRINHVGNPEGVVAANPSSLSHDPVSGNLYLKVSGQGTTLWKQITPTVSASVLTLQGTTGGTVFPDVNGNINILGGVNVAGVLPVSTAGTPNTITVNIQRSQAIAATDSTKVGLSVFNSAQFTVDANGFVSTSGTGVPNTLTGNTGGTISPVAGNINTIGTGSITIAGAGNTLTTQLTGLTNHAVLVGAGTATITKVGPTATAGQILQSAGAAADPVFSTATYPSTTTVNQILYSSSTNVVSGLATANRAVLTTGATGVPVLTALTDGQIIIGSTAGAPAAASITSSDGSITITPGSNSISLTVTGGTTVGKTITGNTGGALSPTAGNWNILGASPASGTSPVTTSGAASTLTVNVQKSQAIAATDATKVGLSNFNSAQFSVDANGFVQLIGSAGPVVNGITVDASSVPGTQPVVPSGAGLVTVTGGQVATGIIGGNVIRTNSLAANTYTTQIQQTTTSAAKDTTKNGVAHFKSTDFTVDEGFVSLVGTIAVITNGTFTPVLSFGVGSTGVTYVSRSGNYTKIGRVVFFDINIQLSSKGSSTGTMRIQGLPFAIGVTQTDCAFNAANLNFGGGVYNMYGILNLGTTYVSPVYAATGIPTSGTVLDNTTFNNASDMRAVGFYFT